MRRSSSRIHVFAWAILALAMATSSQAQVVINEVHYNPAGTDETVLLEFVELHNPGGSAVAIGGWELDFGPDPFVFPGGAMIGAGEYIVVAENIANLAAATGHTAAYEFGALNTGLGNGGDDLVLRDGPEATATIIDSVTYDDDPPWPTEPDSNGPSLELIHPALDNGLASSWRASLGNDGTPGAQNSVYGAGPTVEAEEPGRLTSVETLPQVSVTFSAAVTGVTAADLSVAGSPATAVTGSGAGPYLFSGYAAPTAGSVTISLAPGLIMAGSDPFVGDNWTVSVGLIIVINELHYHPPDLVADAEFLEIYNAGTNTADLTGWIISDGLDMAFPAATTLAPDSYLVIALDPILLQGVTGYTDALPWEGGRLSNGGERLALADADGNELDVVDYSDSGTWDSVPDGNGPSLELINPTLPNQYGPTWAASMADHGTPGAQNSQYQASPPPIIVSVIHDPPIPAALAPVTITAEIVDIGTPLVWVYHRQDQEPTVAYTSTPMSDLGGNLYSVTLPGLAEGERLDFAVVAYNGASSIAPAGHNADFAAGSHPPQTFLCKFSDAPVSPDFPHYHMITTQYTRNLQGTRTKTEYDATFLHCPQGGTVADCEIFYNVVERYRGASSLNQDPPSFRVEFASGNPLESEMGFDITSLNLMGQQPARQTLGYGLFDAVGHVSPKNQLVRLNTNPLADGGTQDFAYINVERIDEDFFESQNGDLSPLRFPDRCDLSETPCESDLDCLPGEFCVPTDGGAAYRGRHNDASLRWEGFDPDAYRVDVNERNGYQQITNEDEDDWTDLINLCDAMNCSSSDGGLLCLEDTYDGWFQDNLVSYAEVDQWAGWFAMHMVLNNVEGGIYRDTGDDYFLYFWNSQNHATFLPWDMDAIIPSVQETIWRTGNSNENWPPRRFLRNNAYAGRFVGAICEYMDTVFTQAAMDARIDALPDALFPTGTPQGNGAQTKQGMKDWVAARRTYINNEIVRQTTLENVPVSPYTDPNPVIGLYGSLNQCGAHRVVINGQPVDSYTIANPAGVGANWSTDYTLVPGNNTIVVQTLDHMGVVVDSVSDSVFYAPPGSGEPDSLHLNMPTRMVNTKTLTLRAEILDGIGEIHWQTWTEVGIVSARRVSDGTPVPTSVTVFETRNAGTGAGGPGPDEIRFYNGVGNVSITLDDPASVAGEAIEVVVDVLGLSASQVVTVLDETDGGLFTPVSGTLSGAVTWGPADGVIHMTGNVTVGSGSTLTIDPGTLIMVDAGPANNGIGIFLNGGGSIQANGTEAEPIMFFPTSGAAALVLPQTQQNNYSSWRGVLHEGAGSSTYSYVFIVGAGNGPTGSHPRSGVLRIEDTHSVVMNDCVVADSPGKGLFVLGNNDVTLRRNSWSRIGYGGECLGGGHTLLIEDSWFTRIGYGPESVDLDGDIFHLDNASSSQTIRRSVLADCGDDMIDHSGANPVVENSLIWDADDKCVSLSSGGSVTFNNVLVFGMPLGVNGAGGILTHVTINVSNTPMGAPISVDNSIIWSQGINTGACDGNINYTLAGTTGHLACGTGNLSANPLFQDPGNYDYSLQAGSPAAAAGPAGGRIGWLGFPDGAVCVGDGDCDDGNACTTDSCDAGACVFNPIPGCTPCIGDPDCDDGDPCTVDSCNAGTCSSTAGNDGAVCDDGWDCTIDDECAAGACAGTESCPPGQHCDGLGVCTSDPLGLVFQQGATYSGTQDTFLQEALPDAVNGALDNFEWDAEDPAPSQNIGLLRFDDIVGGGVGQLAQGTPILSATLTLVIFDESVAPAGAIHLAAVDWDQTTATFNNFGGEAGVQVDEYGAFVADAPIPVGSHVIDVTSAVQGWINDPATNHGLIILPASNNGAQVRASEYAVTPSERPMLSIQYLPTGCTSHAQCDDGDDCNGVETCDIGGTDLCLPGTPVVCDDADACNGLETCDPTDGSCLPGTPLTCDDADACNGVETCDTASGCVAGTPVVCDDADACNGLETCVPADGSCLPGTALVCDDSVACTDDSCDAVLGCENLDNCTDPEVCNLGTGVCEEVQVPEPGDLIISGIMASGSPEWVELFNTTSSAIALDDLEFIVRIDANGDGNATVDWQLPGGQLAGASIPAYGFFLLGEVGTSPAADLETNLDLATGEGGTRAISLDLLIGGVHMDYVLYGRNDAEPGATADVPPGDRPFDGTTFPRTEVIRTCAPLGTGGVCVTGPSFSDGVTQRVSADDLHAGYDVEGFYTDEVALGDGYSAGVWTSAHATTGGNTPRNSSSATVPPPTQPCISDAECDDGLYCNGVETCDIGGTDLCLPGTPVDCGDGVDCTVDTCNETLDACEHSLCSMSVSAIGSRYLSITPPAGLVSVALRVDEPGLSCLPRYVDLNGELGDTPVFLDSATWGTALVADREILPATIYDVQAEVVPGTAIGIGSAMTWPWGQTNNVDDVNMFDVICVLDGFGAVFTHCTPQAVDLMGYAPNRTVDLDDILAVLDAFQSLPYPDTTPCAAPVPPPNAMSAQTEAASEKPLSGPLELASSQGSSGSAGDKPYILVVPEQTAPRPGDLVEVNVYVAGAIDLRGYQVAVETSGGSWGGLEVEDARIETSREDYLLAGSNDFRSVDRSGGRLAGALVQGGVTRTTMAYLGTFVLRVSDDALGVFEIGLRTDGTLFRDSFSDEIEVAASSAVIAINATQAPSEGDDTGASGRDVTVAGEVIIAGFQPWGSPEWITLFNTTNQPVSLANMSITVQVDVDSNGTVETDFTLPTGSTSGTIPAYSFFLIGETDTAPAADLTIALDFATGEGGQAERAIGIELIIDGVVQDRVLYGRHDGSTPAGQIPPGDIAFDGVSWPRTEVLRNTTNIDSFQDGACQRLSAEDLHAGYDVEGFYTDETSLPGTFPAGVWTSPHATTGGTPRNSATAAVPPPATGCTTHAECDDGDDCNGIETCDIGGTDLCLPGTPVVCDDGDVCNGIETCDPADGSCLPGTALVCDDSVACTDDSCDTVLGCQNLDNCTAPEVCNLGSGVCEAGSLWTAYNDLSWYAGQLETNITKITSPANEAGMPSSGLLVEYATGTPTGVTLTIAGGDHLASIQGAEATTGDAFGVFNGIVSTLGVISYVNQPSPAGDLVLTLTGMQPGSTYELVFHGNRDDYAWDRALLATISDVDDFTNESSAATDNPTGTGGTLFDGPTDPSTRLPSGNGNGYVARFIGIAPGSDGDLTLTISFDGTTPYSGKYASALMLREFFSPCTLDAECDDSNLCTDDSCNTGTGQCEYAFNTDPCNDGDFCTSSDTCSGGTCSGNTVDCGTQYCDPADGSCADCLNDGHCADATVCNGDETCSAGTCSAGTPLTCDDAVGCTNDSCDSVLGCQFVDNCPGGEFCNTGSGVCETIPTTQLLPIVIGDDWRYFKGQAEPTPGTLTAWTETGYDDTTWALGGTGIGYDFYAETGGTNGNGDYEPFIATQITDMRSCASGPPCQDPGYLSIYMRKTFTITNPAEVLSLSFEMYADDGYVAYLNGTEVARSGVTGTPPAFDATADSGPAGTDTPPVNHTIDLTGSIGLLVPGPNVLAIQGHNAGLTSRDFLMIPQLSATFDLTGPHQPTLVSPADTAIGISTSPELRVNVTDPDADAMTVTFYGRRNGDSPPAEDFTIIHMTDTQHYSQTYHTTLPAMTQWIRDNRDSRNIVFTTLSGDIVNTATDVAQWQRADAAMAIVEPYISPTYPDGVPFGVSCGNHDVGDGLVNYNTYFGVDRFHGRSYYAGWFDDVDSDGDLAEALANNETNNNHYELFTAGGMDFITIHLEWDVQNTTGALIWANDLLQTYWDRRAIIVSHYLMETGEDASFSVTGQAIYDAVIDSDNLFLMLAGHRHGEGKRLDTGNLGNDIWTMVADYQDYPNGGDGYLRILEFSPANDEIRVFTYSPVLDAFLTDSDSQFVLAYEMEGGVPFVEIGSVSGVASGDDAFITWPGLDVGAGYEWYVTVSDGTSTTTGPTWTFATACTDSAQCDDGNSCTDDSCNMGTGECEYSNNTAVCDDGNLCTSGDVCGGGVCDGAPVSCDAGQTCNPGTGLCEADPLVATFQQGVSGYGGTVDTFLNSGAPTANNAATSPLVVDLNVENHALLRFENLFVSQGGPIPDGATIDDATLTINVTNESLTAGASLHRMLQPWNDTDGWATWGGGLQADDVEALSTADASGSSDVGLYSLDVTASVAAWSADVDNNYGWAWLPPAVDNSWQFHSAEGATPPELSVTYSICINDSECDDGNGCTLDSCTGGACVHVDDDGATCDDGDLCTTVDECLGGACAGTPVSCPNGHSCNPTSGVCEPTPAVLTFQGGFSGYAGTADTFVQTAFPDNVNGALENLEWDDDDPAGDPVQPNFGLIRFDDIIGPGSDQVPQTAVIVSARLYYTVFNSGLPASLHESLIPWDETISMNSYCGATCDEGVEYSASSPDVAVAPAAGLQSADVSSSIEAWLVDPSANLGWMLVPQALPSAGGGVNIRSSEYTAAASERPYLRIEFFEAVCTSDPECDDSNVCNGLETCDTDIGLCLPGTPLDCDDDNTCTDDTCDPVGGCSYVNNTAPCDDGDACTVNDVCAAGLCESGAAADCDDFIDCTADSCDTGLGCQNADNCPGGEVCNHSTGLCETAPVADPLPIVYGDEWKYLKGTAEPSASWNTIGFDDTAWSAGNTGMGYDFYVETGGTNGNGDYEPFIGTQLDDMSECTTRPPCVPVGTGYSSVYMRRAFWVDNAAAVDSLTLEMYADDGCVVYLNGTEVFRFNMTGTPPAYDALATGGPGSGVTPPVEHTIDLTGDIGLVLSGANVLAVQGHNTSLTSRDLLIIPQLSSTETPPCTGDGDCDDFNDCTDDTCNMGSGECEYTTNDANSCTDGVACTDDACSAGVCNSADNCTGGQVCNYTSGICETPPTLVSGDVIIAGFQSANNVQVTSFSEFVSLFNTTDTAISLEGLNLIVWVDADSNGVLDLDWQLTDEAPDLTGATIAPYSFFLVAESGVAAPGGDFHDLETLLDMATGEGGATERAIGIELVVDGVTLDHVLYGRHDGSTPAGDLPPGDITFDGVSWPRTEVIRTTVPTNPSFTEGVCQRLSATDLHSGYDVEGFYTDEDLLGDGYPNGVWTSPHNITFAAYEARNSLSPQVLPPSGQPCTQDSDCDDDDVCNGVETCDIGGTDTCLAGTPLVCDDGNVCTDDACDPVSGCSNLDNTVPCDDGDACTTGDVCGSGVCGGALISCDDGVACTDDSCDQLSGCQNVDNCSGGQTCNLGTGLCESGPTIAYFQDDGTYTGTQDTFLMESEPDLPHGTLAHTCPGTASGPCDNFEWDADDPSSSGQQNIGLIRFDGIVGAGTGQVPQGATVTNATLTITLYDPSAAPAADIYVSLADWDQATTTWNDFGGEAGVQPDELGADIGDAPIGTGTYDIDITPAAQGWIDDPASNFGLIILPNAANGAVVRSSEYATVALRPMLTIEYQAPAGQGQMTCALSSDLAVASGSVDLEVYLEDLGGLPGVRGYQTQIVITPTSGSGTIAPTCPGGVTIDDTRPDWLFFGEPDGYPVTNCGLRRASATLLSGTVTMGASPAYLSTYTLDVSSDATHGSTFEISFAPYPDSSLADVGGYPLDLEFGPACVLTITGCSSDPECDDGNPCTDDACVAGSCENTIDDTNVCDDGDACTVGDACSAGICAGTALSCDDASVCTIDTCVAGSCEYATSGVCDLAGTVYYYRDSLVPVEPSGKTVSGVDIDVDDDAVSDSTTDVAGIYGVADLFGRVIVTTLEKFGTPRASDHNDAISSFDASFVALHVIGADPPLSINQQIAGDVSGNGSLSSYDAARVAQFAAELIDHFEVATAGGSDWQFFRCDNYIDATTHDCTSPIFDHDPLLSPVTDDFYAVLYGDVTGNWTAAAGKTVDPMEHAAVAADRKHAERLRSLGIERPPVYPRVGPAVISLTGWTAPLSAGAQRELQVHLTNADGIEALDLVLDYDPTVLSVVGIETAGIGNEFQLFTNDLGHRTAMAMFGLLPLTGSGSVLTITVEARSDLGRQIPLRLDASANEGRIPLRGTRRAGDHHLRETPRGDGRQPTDRP